MKKSIKLAGLIIFSLISLNVSAQSEKKTVKEKQVNQSERLSEGTKNGSLTDKEAARLYNEQVQIQEQKKAAKADGNYTRDERKDIKKDQKRASRHIYKNKHDAQSK